MPASPSPDPVSEVREPTARTLRNILEVNAIRTRFHDDEDWVSFDDLFASLATVVARLTPAGPEERGEGLRAAVLQAGTGDGVRTNCPLTGVHEHTFRGPHVFDEWYAATAAPDTGAEERLRAALEPCGSRAVGGRCVLPRGHNMGRADVPEAHEAAIAGEPSEVLALVLRDHFVMSEADDTPLDDGDREDADAVIAALAERGVRLILSGVSVDEEARP